MVRDNRYGGYPATFNLDNGAGGSDLVAFLQMGGYTFSPSSQITEITPVGSVDAQSYMMASADANYRITTADLATVFTQLPLAAPRCITGVSNFWYQAREKCGVFSTDAEHINLQFSDGAMYLTQLTASADAEDGAQAEIAIDVLSADGTTLPITLLRNQSLPVSPTIPTFNSQFYMGPLKIGGAFLPGITNWTLETGLEFNRRRTGGAVFPNHGAVRRRQAAVRITTVDLDALMADLSGVFFNDTGSLELFLRRGAENNLGRVADNLGQHFKATATGSVGSIDDVSVQGNDDGTSTVRLLVKGNLTYSITSVIA